MSHPGRGSDGAVRGTQRRVTGTAGVRVASVPSGHPYVAHLGDPAVPGVVRLPDPPVAGAPPRQWWPSPSLEASWVREHAPEFDVLHVHFGFEHRTPHQLRELVGALRERRRTLVLTVHDLRNPHLPGRARHDAQLDVLVPAADGLITLTPGAAAHIARRWHRRARVVPHPHVVPDALLDVPRPAHDGFVIGVHAKSVRANTDPVAVATALAPVVAQLPGARLQVDAHDDQHGRAVAAALPGLDVRVHPRFTDTQLWDYLLGLDVSVLPYRWGTHSGWSEACHDLGTTVLAPDCGRYPEQGPCVTFHHDEHGLDAGSLATAVQVVHAYRPRWRAGAAARRAQRLAVAVSHAEIYADALAVRR